jgi:hypothetical protein
MEEGRDGGRALAGGMGTIDVRRRSPGAGGGAELREPEGAGGGADARPTPRGIGTAETRP